MIDVATQPLFSCGVRDHELARAGDIARWPTKNLTYAITGYLPEFDRAEYGQAVRGAFNNWEAVCDLHFTEVNTTNANVIISAGRGQRVNLDGPGNILAWCQIPVGNVQQVLLMMDLDEQWALRVQSGQHLILVGNVLTHELGHGIGIYHITDGRQALMNPVYAAAVTKPLGPDIEQAVMRYGTPAPVQPPAPPTPAPNPTPVPTPTPTPPTPNRTPIELFIGGRLQWKGYAQDFIG